MALLPRWRFGTPRAKEAALEERVTALQAALASSKAAATRWTTIAILILALGFALGVYGEPLKQAVTDLAVTLGFTRPIKDADAANTAYQKGDYETALRIARPLADGGDARAQSLLGLAYSRGRGVPQDNLETIRWFRLAANQGDVSAQFYLGEFYAEGKGVPQDYAEAAKWFGLAADEGDPHAQYNLGHCYANGHGLPQDNVNAYMWFNLAAARFPASDTRNRGAAATSRDAVASKMTPDQIVEAQKLAREWNPKSKR